MYESAGEEPVAEVPGVPEHGAVRRSARNRQVNRDPDYVWDQDLDRAVDAEEDSVSYFVDASVTSQQHVDAAFLTSSIPVTFGDAQRSGESEQWSESMDAEMQSHQDYRT